jgi:DNA replication protein DnaC
VSRRAQKQLALRVRRSGMNSTKTLDSFDFNFNPSVNRQQVLDLAAGDYIRQQRNVLICGPTGVGKSHLAQALAQEACVLGFDVLSSRPTKSCSTSTGVGPTAAVTGACRPICVRVGVG